MAIRVIRIPAHTRIIPCPCHGIWPPLPMASQPPDPPSSTNRQCHPRPSSADLFSQSIRARAARMHEMLPRNLVDRLYPDQSPTQPSTLIMSPRAPAIPVQRRRRIYNLPHDVHHARLQPIRSRRSGLTPILLLSLFSHTPLGHMTNTPWPAWAWPWAWPLVQSRYSSILCGMQYARCCHDECLGERGGGRCQGLRTA